MDITDFFAMVNPFLLNKQRLGASEHTISAYRRDLNQLQTIFHSGSLNGTVHRQHFIFAIKKLSIKNTHPRSMARKLSVWHSYVQYLIEHQLLQDDPTLGLKAPKQPARLPKAIAQEELNQLLNQSASTNDDFYHLRDQAIFELLYGSGLRVSEAVALDQSHLNLSEGWVRVQGKGQRTRHTPLTTNSIQALQAYLAVRPTPANSDALFISWQGKRISARRIQQCLNQWAITQQSTRHISPHMLRHSFASHLLQSSGNIRAVQELLGHRRLSTTQIYTKLDFDHLAKVYDENHPRAKKKNEGN